MSNQEKINANIVPETREIHVKELLRDAAREIIGTSLYSQEGLEGIKAWRGVDEKGQAVRTIRKFLDTLSAYDAVVRKNPDVRGAASAELMELFASDEETIPTRQEELVQLFLAEKLGEQPHHVHPEVQRIFDSLTHVPSSEGETDVAELLTSSNIPLKAKALWFESQLLSSIKFLERKDRADLMRALENPPSEDLIQKKDEAVEKNVPPPASDSFRPSMEEMERSREGEPGAYFTVAPFYGGYYRERDYDVWNPRTLSWERSAGTRMEPAAADVEKLSRRVIAGTVRHGAKTSLPMPYGFCPDGKTLKVHGMGSMVILEGGRGEYVLDAGGAALISFSVEIGRGGTSQEEKENQSIRMATGTLSRETETKLAEIKTMKASQIEKARLLKSFVRSSLQYSNDSSMNAVYQGGKPKGYFQRIERHKKADCDVANTYFAALLSRLDIPVRMVTGHYVKVKDRKGNAVMSSGTAHAWVEVWNPAMHCWEKLDATPPGDPSMDDEEMEDVADDAILEGDFAEQEADEISQEELEQMIADAKAMLDSKERKHEETATLRFAEDAGCTPEEAKEILKQIELCRELRDRRGRKIRDRIVAEFQKIVKDNQVERLRYKAPVRMSDADDLADPVEASVDIQSGEADPGGFAKHEQRVEREQIYGGFDALFVVDKSGSMGETDPKTAYPKWKEQQRFIFLCMDALSFTAREFKRERIRLISPIDIRTSLVSFKAGGATVELPLGTQWGPKEQYRVWKALQENVGGGTPDHLGLQSVQRVIEEDIALHPQEKKRLRIVIVGADGGSDNNQETMRAKEQLKSIGVIVKAAGIGSGAKEVEATYYPDGKNLESFEDVPGFAADEIITEAKKMYPRKIKK